MTRGFSKNKKGAMEMSVGTIVTIVLLMTVLVLGIFFVQKIFSSSNSAIDTVNNQVQNQINQLFSDGSAKIALYPTSGQVTVKRGASPPQGFAFSIYNNGKSEASFNYSVYATDVSDCKDTTTGVNTVTPQIATNYLIGGTTSSLIKIGAGQALGRAVLVTLSRNQDAPPCTIVYTIAVDKVINGVSTSYDSATMQVSMQ